MALFTFDRHFDSSFFLFHHTLGPSDEPNGEYSPRSSELDIDLTTATLAQKGTEATVEQPAKTPTKPSVKSVSP